MDDDRLIVAAALAIGFEEAGGTYICTKEQLLQFAIMVAASAIEQVIAEKV